LPVAAALVVIDVTGQCHAEAPSFWLPTFQDILDKTPLFNKKELIVFFFLLTVPAPRTNSWHTLSFPPKINIDITVHFKQCC
jgi:hypothetical protein